MAAENFIPKIWTARLLAHLDKTLVFRNLTNSDYEGEIQNEGDTVKINQINDISVSDYKRGTALTYEEVGSTQKELKIDQSKLWKFSVNDIDAVQANTDLVESAMERAAYALGAEVDTDIAAVMAAGAKNTISKIALTVDNAYDKLVDMSVALDEENVQADGRWVVLPPWVYGLLQKDTRFVASGAEAADGRLGSGYIGTAAGFNVYKSNNLGSDTEAATTDIIAGVNMATTFASQLVKTETLRDKDDFDDYVRGLMVYGRLVVQPSGLVVLKAAKG